MHAPLIRRVRLRNYKSIQSCDVELGALTFLVGPNGAGKSNFVDALRFVKDALDVTLGFAVSERSGIGEVRRKGSRTGHPTHVGIRLEFELPSGSTGRYAFDVSAKSGGDYAVQKEQCVIVPAEGLGTPESFTVEQGAVDWTLGAAPPPRSPDRLFLVTASGYPEFRPVFDSLTHMGFYNLNPVAIMSPQKADPGLLLRRDGANIASVLAYLAKLHPAAKRRIEEYLGAVVPGIRGVERIPAGPLETLEFRQEADGAGSAVRFAAASMSDGTLRALGVLVALLQPGNGDGPGATLVGIEEPELALHPAASGVLLDALSEASERVQVIVTSHSTALLDSDAIATETLRAVTVDRGKTVIGPIDDVGRTALAEHLFTAGELLRLDQLRPHAAAFRDASRQLDLFSSR